jgi:flagellar basal body-associated protein FliL
MPLIAGGVAVLLLLAGGGTFLVLRKGSDAPAAEKAEGEEHAAKEDEGHEAAEHGSEEHGDEHASVEHAEEEASAHEESGESHGEEAAEGHGEEAAGGEHGGPPPPKFVSIDSFVVNVSDGEGDRFLKVKIDLEVSSAEVGKEIDDRMPQVKDILIGLLSSQNATTVRSMEGKDKLREQVLTRLNAVVRTGVVRQVLFTEFVVQ